jgi:hypothetical protein
VTEEAYARSSCYAALTPSPYLEGLEDQSRDAHCLAAAIGSMGSATWSKINPIGMPVPNTQVLDAFQNWKAGFKIDAKVGVRGGAWIAFSALALELAPTLVWPPNPFQDAELVRKMSEFLKRCRYLPLVMSIATVALMPRSWKRPKVDSVARSTLWARSQGNTLANSLKDYRFRPSFGGVRMPHIL